MIYHFSQGFRHNFEIHSEIPIAAGTTVRMIDDAAKQGPFSCLGNKNEQKCGRSWEQQKSSHTFFNKHYSWSGSHHPPNHPCSIGSNTNRFSLIFMNEQRERERWCIIVRKRKAPFDVSHPRGLGKFAVSWSGSQLYNFSVGQRQMSPEGVTEGGGEAVSQMEDEWFT